MLHVAQNSQIVEWLILGPGNKTFMCFGSSVWNCCDRLWETFFKQRKAYLQFLEQQVKSPQHYLGQQLKVLIDISFTSTDKTFLIVLI